MTKLKVTLVSLLVSLLLVGKLSAEPYGAHLGQMNDAETTWESSFRGEGEMIDFVEPLPKDATVSGTKIVERNENGEVVSVRLDYLPVKVRVTRDEPPLAANIAQRVGLNGRVRLTDMKGLPYERRLRYVRQHGLNDDQNDLLKNLKTRRSDVVLHLLPDKETRIVGRVLERDNRKFTSFVVALLLAGTVVGTTLFRKLRKAALVEEADAIIKELND